MAPTRLLIGQAVLVFAIVIGGVWAATQWAAAMLGYQPRLGLAWFELYGLPIYYPWRLFEWWYSYGAYAPEKHATRFVETGSLDFLGGRPARRSIGRDEAALPRSPQGATNGDNRASDTASRREHAGALEHPRRG